VGIEYTNFIALSLCHGKCVVLDHVGYFVDNREIMVEEELTFNLCRGLMENLLSVVMLYVHQ